MFKYIVINKLPFWFESRPKTNQPSITTVDKFEYDDLGRLTKQTQKINSQAEELIAFNEYDELGQLKRKKVGNTQANPLQNIDYTYNIRGWLKKINDPTSLGDKLFAFKLNYNTTEMGINGVDSLFNGNISETIWRTANTETYGNRKRGYAYQYDALNRIKSGAFRRGTSNGSSFTEQASNYNLTGMVYDLNGNIRKLKRYGPISINSQGGVANYGVMDDLTYSYDMSNSSNRLMQVSDAGSKDYGFKDGATSSAEFGYDVNGNMIKDLNKGIGSIAYNHLNLPEAVNVTSNKGDGTGTISYIYDATGVKLKKTAPGNMVTEYTGNYVYKNGTLEFINHAEGYVENENNAYKYVYQYKDHLGNVRLSYSDTDLNGSINPSTEIIEEKNYYPFGGTQKGYNNVVNGTAHPYGFGGKEEQDELGLQWMDFGARNYDKWLGRWMNVDPMADRNYSWTPFRYAYNNPLKFVDPDGLYERDGHYWTVYLAGMVSGRSDSGSIAYWAEEPDHVMSTRGDVLLATNTWMYPRNQRDWHALTGGNAIDERARSRGMFGRAGDAQQRGYALHRLGDSYSHSKSNGKMYPNGIGHALQGHAPDKIANRPDLYLEYVNDLVGTLGGNSNSDMFTFEYVAGSGGSTEQNSAVFETEIRLREGVSTFSVLGDQTGVIGDYLGARDENYGSNTSYKTFVGEAEKATIDENGNIVGTGEMETRTFVIFN